MMYIRPHVPLRDWIKIGGVFSLPCSLCLGGFFWLEGLSQLEIVDWFALSSEGRYARD